MSDAQDAKWNPQQPGSIRVYSPWIPREGGHLRSTLEAVQVKGTKIKMDVFTQEKVEEKSKRQEEGGKV